MTRRIIFLFLFASAYVSMMTAQHVDSMTMASDVHTAASTHSEAQTTGHGDGGHHVEEYDPASTAIHHISDANVYSILDAVRIPLPMILHSKDKGWDFFMSSKFQPSHHEDGLKAYNGYVMLHGSVNRITDPSFPMGDVAIKSFTHKEETIDDKLKTINYAIDESGKEYRLDARTTWDGGILGGGITSFTDLSPTKNVVSMLLIALFFILVFRSVAKAYRTNPDKAPKGTQNIVETIFVYMRDEVAIPFIGKDKYKKYFPLLMSIFFFILGLNLFGQVPFFGSTNVTGNITVTMILSLIVFIIVNINGNKHYWQHILWMPGVPTGVKPLLSIIEIASLFIKPLTMMLRLAGNISAGHIAILSFIGLIFVFGKSGQSMVGSGIGTAMAVPLTLFMMAIELLVAFLQAYVFTLLAASYIGAATEEHGHGDHH